VSVGNDVVDLDDPETRLDGLHPRWSERVFSDAEREALHASRSRHRLHWALWAAKESAFKARKRLDPSAVFSPRLFEVELSDLPATGDAVATGRVVHRGEAVSQGEAFSLEVHVDGSSVHAMATSEDEAGAQVLCGVHESRGDPSGAARRLAALAIGSALRIDPAGVRVVGRPPVARLRDGRTDFALSLSHHGRFVAFACALAGAALARDQALGLSMPCMASQLTKASNQPVLVVSLGYMPKP
jgi:phosphopantetheinyl transferase (holo-ACP synthase)